MMMARRGGCWLPRVMVAFWFVLIVAINSASAYTEKENLAFIDKILVMLNNNEDCHLPTYEEITEVKKSFDELEKSYGSSFQSRLSADQKLIQSTVLDQWDSFQARMVEGSVVIRSAKKRSFMCKIEQYQVAKFGDSICTSIKQKLGPKTDHIFEKNPLVRYIKHLETQEVIERPAESSTAAPQTEDANIESPAESGETTEPPAEQEAATPKAPTPDKDGVVHRLIGQFTIEYPNGPREIRIRVDPEYDGDKEDDERDPLDDIPVPSADDEKLKQQQEEEERRIREEEEQQRIREEEEQQRIKQEEEKRKQKEEEELRKQREREQREEELRIQKAREQQLQQQQEQQQKQQEQEEELKRQKEKERQLEEELRKQKEQQEKEEEEERQRQQKEQEEKEERERQEAEAAAAAATTVAPPPSFGSELIDDSDLERLVRAPRKDWEFDPIYEYFKWPDENPGEGGAAANQQLDPAVLADWAEFTRDPVGYDKTHEVPKKLNAVALRRKKKEFLRGLAEERRHEQRQVQFGWINADVAPQIQVMPEVNRNRWVKVADNNFCKIDYNRDYIPNATKRGYHAVKSLFVQSERQGISNRRRLIS